MSNVTLFQRIKVTSAVVKWDVVFFAWICRTNKTLVNMTGSGSGDTESCWEWKMISNMNQISIEQICKFLWTITVKLSHLSEQIWGNRSVVQILLAQRKDGNEALMNISGWRWNIHDAVEIYRLLLWVQQISHKPVSRAIFRHLYH